MSKTSKPEVFAQLKYPIIAVPFHGTLTFVQLRELTQAQIMACGEFSLIETFQDKIARGRQLRPAEVVGWADLNYEIVKASLVQPKYEDILKAANGDQFSSGKREELAKLKEELRKCPKGPQRTSLEQEINQIRILVDLILPEDFVGAIVSYALGVSKSDIKTVSEEMLLNAAILAERGHDNPADHIDGSFTAFMRDDVNMRAWAILEEEKDKRRGR